MSFIYEEIHDEEISDLTPTDAGQLVEAYSACVFKRCNLQDADLSRIRLSDCQFIACNFSLSQWQGATLTECLFTECKLLGIDWTRLQTQRANQFRNCRMDGCQFQNLNLSYSSFQGSRLHDVDFSQSNLKAANLTDTDLSGATFEQTDLRNADLRGAVQYLISPLENKIRGAKFSASEALNMLACFGIEIF